MICHQDHLISLEFHTVQDDIRVIEVIVWLDFAINFIALCINATFSHDKVLKENISTFSEADLTQPLAEQHYFYKPKCFPHFMYIRKLVRNLKSEVEKVIKMGQAETAIQTDVIIEITYVGEITEENLRLVTKKRGDT